MDEHSEARLSSEGVTISETQTPYEAAIKEKWGDMMKFYEKSESSFTLFRPTTVAGDNGLHMVVYSGSKEPLEHLIRQFFDPTRDKNRESLGFVFLQNKYGNTVLHEAAAIGNFEAVKFIVDLCHGTDILTELLETKNHNGETALFKAAAFGSSTASVRFLAKREGQIIDQKLKDVHRQRNNSKGQVETSVLHVAIQGEHFGTALELLNLDGSLAELKDKNGMDSLQLLATRPSAFGSGSRKGIWRRFFYLCMPAGDDYDDEIDLIDDDDYDYKGEGDQPRKDLESGVIKMTHLSKIKASIWRFFISIRRIFFRACPTLRKIWEEKRKHKLALKLAKQLIEKDKSGTQTEEAKLYNEGRETDQPIKEHIKVTAKTELKEDTMRKDSNPVTDIPILEKYCKPSVDIPLLLATKSGIKEIVDEILRVHPQAIEHTSPLNQNILHIAIMHRQREIFKSVSKIKMPMTRLVRMVDKHGYNILHHAADNKHVKGGSRPGPAYELQEELKWFKRVKKIAPSHYVMYTCKIEEDKQQIEVTPKELFDRKHKNQLEEAQKWIKDTSQSCSAVAVLVATVVFAAAYTLPGGNNRKGFPIFLDSPFFMFFTVMDIASLASSLTSVVMFLSILTSPFRYYDFLYSLPQTLTFGFALLFFSVATTMLAFAATILLLIRLEPHRWTSTLVYSAAFLPVSVLALTQFPMFFAFRGTLKNVLKATKKFIPLDLVFKLPWFKRKTN